MASKYQKRHYEDVARILFDHAIGGDAYPDEIRDVVMRRVRNLRDTFAALFAADNPLFDRERFLKACGLEAADDPAYTPEEREKMAAGNPLEEMPA